MNRPFVVLLSIAVALGVGLGGAFAGGVALGKSSVTDSQANINSGPADNFSQQSGQFGQGSGGRFQPGSGPDRQGSATQGPLTLDRRSGNGSVESFGQSFDRRFEGRNAVSGIVENIEGQSITVKTSQGETAATITRDTTINKIAEVSIDELQVGDQVTVIGPVDDSDTITASTIVINPEGLGRFFGGGEFRQRGSRAGQERP